MLFDAKSLIYSGHLIGWLADRGINLMPREVTVKMMMEIERRWKDGDRVIMDNIATIPDDATVYFPLKSK